VGPQNFRTPTPHRENQRVYTQPSTTTKMAPRRQVGTEISGNARRGRNLLPEERQQIIGLRARGVPVKELMEEFGCSKSAIKYTTRTYTTTLAQDKPYTGRPCMLLRH
jgi:DNA invertase Pin-like site-specific DNA recombinase